MKNKIGLYRDPRNKGRPWVARWFGECEPDGKQRRYSRSFRLKAEAEAFQAAKMQEFRRGTPRDGVRDITLSSFCKEWLSARKKELRPASVELYHRTNKRLLDYFGKDVLLKEIKPRKAAAFIVEQRNRAIGSEGKQLSDASREQLKRHCKTIFETAVEWELLKKNPFKSLRMKRTSVKRWHRVTVKEYLELLKVAPNLRWQVFYALAYTSGARMGELFSLTWNDVDFENGKQIIANREGTADMPPFEIKDHEARRIPLPAHTIDLLTELFNIKEAEGTPYILLDDARYELVRVKWQRLRKEGKPWRNRYMVNNVLRTFKSHYKRAGIKPVGKLTIHTLRKSCIQNWADDLPMNVVKELAGHSSIATTQKYYTQVDSDHEAKVARVIQQRIDSAAKSNESDVKVTYLAKSVRKGVIS